MSSQAKPLDKEIRADRRLVAGWLLWCDEREQQYRERREEILHSSLPPLFSRPPVQLGLGDTTGKKGAELGDLARAERWIRLVREIEARLPWEMQVLLQLKRKYKMRGTKGRPVRWLIALELSEEVSRRLGKEWCAGVKQVDRWWQRILDYAVILAAKRGVI